MSRAIMMCTALSLCACRSHSQPGPLTIGPSATVPKRGMPDVPVAADANDWDDDDTGGLGWIETRNAAGDPGQLRLDAVNVRARQVGDYAEVQAEHRFFSDAAVPLEGTFRLSLPDGAIVTGLAMMVDGKMIEGELVDNARAKKIYQEIVDQMQDPVLMEWEHGTTFKMRVFPIEPGQEKIVTLRYLAPLRARGGVPRFVQGTRGVDGAKIAALSVEWNGQAAFAEKDVARGRVLELVAAPTPAVQRESRADGTFTAVRVRPDWSKVAPPKPYDAKRFLVIVDTSRSALEEHRLATEALRGVLRGLPADATFRVGTSDLETELADGWQTPTPAHIDGAVKRVESTTIDGATDLGAMLKTAGEAAHGVTTSVVYIGDCEPSWGETDPGKLGELATAALGDAPLFPLLLGNNADLELGRTLAAATGGRAFRAQKPRDVERFSRMLTKNGKRIGNIAVEPIAGSTIVTDGMTTLDDGEELLVLVSTPADATPPKVLTMRADAGATLLTTMVPLDGEPTPLVARRYGAAQVRAMERTHAPKEEIIATSIAFTVMSKHTSFLVLDSEEAYKRYDIERRAKRANADVPNPSVDSLDPESASISADRIQPGDPEIEIDAPRDAERVFVVLPNGETKRAVWDADARHGRGAWVVRFLVDRDVPEGVYQARVFIELADGRTETRTVSYTVDTTAPKLDVRLTPRRDGRIGIDVRQPQGDARRVEVLTPDGQVLTLGSLKNGRFVGRWKPTRPVHGESMHVVGVDEALNHTALDVVLP